MRSCSFGQEKKTALHRQLSELGFFYSRNLATALVCCLMINLECSLETDMLSQCLWQVQFKEITHNTTGQGLTLRVGAQLLAQSRHSTCKTALQLQLLPNFSARLSLYKNTVAKFDGGFVLFMQLYNLSSTKPSF